MLSTVDRITDMVKQIENEDNDKVKIEDLLEAFDKYKKVKDVFQGNLCIQKQAKNNIRSSGSNLSKIVKG